MIEGVKFVELTLENYKEAVELCVSPEQERFVGTTAEAIADAHFHPQWIMKGIISKEDNTMIGFIMYDPVSPKTTPNSGGIVLERFLIDCKYQGKGYGTAALKLWKEELRENFGPRIHAELWTNNNNSDAIKLYEKMGFIFHHHHHLRECQNIRGELNL